MSVHSKERFEAIATLTAIGIVAVAIWWAYAGVKEAKNQLQQANSIARGVSDLRLVAINYFTRRHEHTHEQWRAVSKHVDQVIADNQPLESEQLNILNDLRERTELTKGIFEQLSLPAPADGMAVQNESKRHHEAKLFDQLVANQRESVADAFQLTDLATERLTLAQQHMVTVTLAGLLLIVLMKAFASWFASRREPAQIAGMKQGMRNTAASKWNFRFGIGSIDDATEYDPDHAARATKGRDQGVTALHFQKALHENEQTLLLTLDAAKIGHWDLDLITREARCSPRNDQIFGHDEAADWTYDIFLTHVLAEDRERVDSLFQAAVAARTEWDFECRITRCDGALRWIWAHGHVFTNEAGEPVRMIGVVSDITERKQAEAAQRESESRYRLLVQHSPYCIHEIDLDGRLTSMNRAGLAMMCVQDDAEICGMHYLDTVADSDKERIGRLLELALQGQPAEFEFVAVNNLKFQSSFVPILDDKGAVQRLMGLTQDITERKQVQEEVERLAYTDALTHLPSRAALQLRLGQAVRQAQSHSRTMALLLLDLNNFREINDTLGHQNGDRVLVQVADRLRRALWDSDVLARLGGDEFAVLLPRLADKEHIKLVLAKIMGALNSAIMIEGIALDVQTSIGIALYPDHGQDADTLMRHADVALYNAKERNLTHLLYDSESDHYNPQQLVLMAELRLALQRDELVLHYQPVVDIKSGKTVGVEALVRWQHPSRGLLYPDTFILAAEKTGLIAALTTWVLANALRQQHRWHRAGIDLNVSVNLSVRNLQQPDIVVEISDMLLSSGVKPECLTLEITESAIMVDPERAKAVLIELHELGIRFAIDDFGIGHSSLGYLKELPVDKLKVDKSFVMDSKSLTNAAIVRATISLAHSLGLTVTAEGVEDDQTFSALKLLGCEQAQGYYMSRPQAVDKLSLWLRESPWGLPKISSERCADAVQERVDVKG